MYYYRNKRKKYNKAQYQPKTIEPPLNDVWDSLQEPKSYRDFGISDEAFAFLSNPEKGKLAQENNDYWNAKKSKTEKVGCSIIVILVVLFHIVLAASVLLLEEIELIIDVLIVLIAVIFASVIVYFIVTTKLDRKLI